MTVVKINARGSNGGGAGYNDLSSANGYTNANLDDVNGVPTGWAATLTHDGIISGQGAASTSSDAEWVGSGAGYDGVYESGGLWGKGLFLENLDDSKTYNIRVFCSIGYSGRVTEIRANEGASQTLASHDGTAANSTDDVRFLGVSPVSGEIFVECRRDASSSGQAYVNAFYVEEVAGASISLDSGNDVRSPGDTISFTYQNFAGDPTSGPVSVSVGSGISHSTDDAARFLTNLTWGTDTVDGDGKHSGSGSVDLSGLPAAGSSSKGLPFQSGVKLNIVDPGA